MKHEEIDADGLRHCLEAAAAVIIAEESRLNALDAAVGDGDHGITMRLGFNAVRRKISTLDASASIQRLLHEAGRAFMGATGGAIGPLLGGMFMAAGTAVSGTSKLGTNEFRTALQAMEASLSRMGKAQPGDKTILDAVHASYEAVAASEDPDLGAAFTKAAAAAAAAAQATADMRSAKGRSSRLGERVLGHPDPGAVSFSLILGAFANCLRNHPST
jgi:dihydroxyacetone kinase-like protein